MQPWADQITSEPQFPYQSSGVINSAAAGEACSTDAGDHVEHMVWQAETF